MKLTVDSDKFDSVQPSFVRGIIESIRRHLEESGIKGDALKEMCGNIAFSVCTEIDSSAGFEVDGIEYSSFLAFSSDDETMFYPGGNSYLHEFVFGVVDEVFEGGA